MSDNKGLRWKTEMADAIAIIMLKEEVIDLAIITGRALGPFGLAHRIISEAEHQQRFLVGRQPVVDPGEHNEGDDAVVMANRTRVQKKFDLQQKLDPELETIVEATYPDRIRNMLTINYSLRHLTLEQQFTYLIAHLPLTQEDLRTMTLAISAPFLSGVKIETHVALQRQAIAHLATALQPISNLEATQLMKKSFNATTAMAQDFAPCFAEFLKDHGAIVEQTPANFATHIIKYVNERLVHHQTVNEAQRATMRVAKSAIEDPLVHTPEQEAAYQAYLAIGKGDKQQPVKKIKVVAPTPAVAVAPRAPRQLAAGAPPFYCWSHGTNFTATYPHYSHERCPEKKPGHKKAATFANQMGGAVI